MLNTVNMLEELVVSKVNDRTQNKREKFQTSMRSACKKIAPLWPLESFVAVNPYLGLIDEKFNNVAQKLADVAAIQMTLPVSFYKDKLASGEIEKDDIQQVLNKNLNSKFSDADEFLNHIYNSKDKLKDKKLKTTFSDYASNLTNKDWNSFIATRISVWAASHYDTGQAIWSPLDKSDSLFASWKSEASVDRTPEVAGLSKFRKAIKSLPDNAIKATIESVNVLGIPEEALDFYFHSLLLRLGGWSGFSARIDWENELYGGKDGELIEFLAVLTCWDACLFQTIEDKKVKNIWNRKKHASNTQNKLRNNLTQKLILQEAFDVSAQRAIIEKFKNRKSENTKSSLSFKAQAVFCIDVRSETYRRNLEGLDGNFETFGFAGFFGIPIKYVPIAHQSGIAQCPVLLKTGPVIKEELANEIDTRFAIQQRQKELKFKQSWKYFKSGAVSCFSFVSPLGLTYLPKLFTDSFGLSRPVPDPTKIGLSKDHFKQRKVVLDHNVGISETTGILFDDQCTIAKNILKAMSLNSNYGKYILIVGHGSESVNNPHASGLDCGACGGNSGESNAKVAVAILNNVNVREHLLSIGVIIPKETVFLACLHNTTTDEISIFNEYDVTQSNNIELSQIKNLLDNASQNSRIERSSRMQIKANFEKQVRMRSSDWSQTRPEWGLAGCHSFIVAPRERTKKIDFSGKAFLHSYDWKLDDDFSILELIMTAPMIVTSWINLQYYASTVDNDKLGSGNKTLHNVTGGVGVIEGGNGDLRVGLPLQSVFDGEKYQHEPIKLNVIIEAPIEAMNSIIDNHKMIKDLCDNEWIHLLAMDQSGEISQRYIGNLTWEKVI
jgi:uncharacterized protein YbcC (UPF0753/DUF2309 family)